jgi:hypothetical protein
MKKQLKIISGAIFTFAFAFSMVASAGEYQCGDRVHFEDVLVLNLEEFVDQQELFEQQLHHRAGDTVLITATPLKVSWDGSRVATIKKASKSAAHQGCDLVVVLGESITETRYEGRVIQTRNLVVHMGKRENPKP